MHGSPRAIASNNARGNPSQRDGSTNRSWASKTSRTAAPLGNAPANVTRFASPSREATARMAGSNRPSPTSVSVASKPLSTQHASAFSKSSWPLYVCSSVPTQTTRSGPVILAAGIASRYASSVISASEIPNMAFGLPSLETPGGYFRCSVRSVTYRLQAAPRQSRASCLGNHQRKKGRKGCWTLPAANTSNGSPRTSTPYGCAACSARATRLPTIPGTRRSTALS